MKARDWAIVAVCVLGWYGACRYAFRPRPVPAVPSTAPVESTHPNDPEPVDVVIVPTPEPDTTPGPCEGLGDTATLACVLASPLDLDSFSDAVLARAERAALRERLSTLAAVPPSRSPARDQREPGGVRTAGGQP